VRVAATLAAVGCLSIVGLSVSRGSLLGTALGITLALRRLLRRGFVPLLAFIILCGIMSTFGVFDSMISHYTKRGTEESGRGLVWPVAIERFLSSPLLGVGASRLSTYVPKTRQSMTTHNSFIYVALTSGVLPFALFVAMWIRAAQNVFSYGARGADGPFRLPLLGFAFVMALVGDLTFMAPWGILTFVVAMASSPPYGGRRLVVHRVEKASTGSTLWTPR
jgi:O-antigen ligase